MKMLLAGILFLALSAGVLIYFGAFGSVPVTIETLGGEILVYESLRGEYKQSAAAMDRVYDALQQRYGIETRKGFGVFYDDPRRVEKEKLRSEAGCILENADISRAEELSRDFLWREFPRKEYITSEFPYKGKISVLFSLMKVYPALSSFARDRGMAEDSPVMEIYDIPAGKIFYRKEIISVGDGP